MDKKIYSSEIERGIKSAVENFEIVLREQVARNQRMRAEREEKDAANKTGDLAPNSNRDKVIIGTAAGDGIGPIIMTEAEKVLKACKRHPSPKPNRRLHPRKPPRRRQDSPGLRHGSDERMRCLT